jgi:FlaA1/EpsC-like NDP-sugar epimerase
MIEALVRLVYKRRRLFSLIVHAVLVAVSSYMAFWLRFDGMTPFEQRDLWWNLLPLLIVTRAAVFVPLRLHEGLWRYTGFWDLRNIVAGVVISSGAFYTLSITASARPDIRVRCSSSMPSSWSA